MDPILSYGDNMLNLQVVRGFIRRLLENAKVVRFLTANYRDILSELESFPDTRAALGPTVQQRVDHLSAGGDVRSPREWAAPAN